MAAAAAPGGAGEYNVVVLGPLMDEPLGLYKCVYGPLASKRMVKRGPHTNPPPHYEYLCGLEHSTMLAIDDFFVDNVGGCLVVECVDETFKEWIHRTARAELFTPTSDATTTVRLSPKLRKLILELASLADCLIKQGYYPVGLNIDALFIKNMRVQGPTLKVLLDYNVTSEQVVSDTVSTWTAVRDVIDYCCHFHGVNLDDTSTSFKDYIGRHKSARDLQAYPDTWTDRDKINYIFMICQGDIDTMHTAIGFTNVDWPLDPADPSGCTAVPIIEAIYLHHVNNNKATYEFVPGHYIRLCRNVLKSFDVPDNVATEVGHRSGFLRKMEEFHPKIWTSLYEEIGPLGGQ